MTDASDAIMLEGAAKIEELMAELKQARSENIEIRAALREEQETRADLEREFDEMVAQRDLLRTELAAPGDETLFGNLEVRMAGYYFGFAQTGVKPVDAILSAVACAGKAYHHTNGWEDDTEPYEDIHRGASPVLWIQHAASDCAELISRLSASYSAAVGERDLALAKVADLEHERLLVIAQGI